MSETIERLGPVTVHKFELRKLGKAPFRCVGYLKNVYVACQGAPEQPGGTCDYCGTGIMHEFHVLSADGRRFKVGCDCIQKIGDEGLKRLCDANPDYRRMMAEKRSDLAYRKACVVDNLLAVVLFEKAGILAEMPHPANFFHRHTGQPLTRLDWAKWMASHCGRSGRASLLKGLQKL